MAATAPRHTLPAKTGVGYKPQHYRGVTEQPGPVGWLEIHAENYMGQGGRPLAQLRALADRFPISVHGVGLSIGGAQPLDTDHLARLKYLTDWLQPASFSEHLAWSTHDGQFLNDLLPLPYTATTLSRVADHIDQVQTVLGRPMLLENPSTYLAFAETEMSEVAFLSEITRRTGCGLLLDINNVFVSATNQQLDPIAYIDAFPLEAVGEIHLGGHDQDHDDHGAPLLIDSHGTEVADPVWDLYAHTLRRCGPRPTLIEWDTDVPDWLTLRREAERADAMVAQTGGPGSMTTAAIDQTTFRAALFDAQLPVPGSLTDPEGRPAGKRFDVYRNNVAVSLTRALETGFPVLRKLVGDDFFAAMAGVYLRTHPPTSPVLQTYGQDMPAFLRAFPPVKTLPYLPDIARVELALRDAYHAADAATFDPTQLSVLDGAGLNSARFSFAPATRLIRSPFPIHGIWQANTEAKPGPSGSAPRSSSSSQSMPLAGSRAENILVTRPEFDPLVTPLSPPQAVFVTALIESQSLSQALLRAGAVPGDFDLTETLGLLFRVAAIASLTT